MSPLAYDEAATLLDGRNQKVAQMFEFNFCGNDDRQKRDSNAGPTEPEKHSPPLAQHLD